jgi:SAM-dependent methyltransferase
MTTSRVGVLVVAYNAAATLAEVLDRLPAGFRSRVDHVLVGDDASTDDTYEVGLGYRSLSDLPLTVIRHPQNLGYGGNQKSGYRWAIEHGLDVVVLLHGDGQYAPEVIEDLVGPLERGECDAVFGSRMMTGGAARAGGMPTYKYVGNRILTTVENSLTGLRLSEWHSGYRAYRTDALASIDFERNSDGFDFDTEIILQLHAAGRRICEVPIPTYYGDEICHVNGMKYAWDVTADVVRYRLGRIGFGVDDGAAADGPYELKHAPDSSHGRLLSWLSRIPPAQVLDVGCSDGSFGAEVRGLGHEVVGVDVERHPGVDERLDDFHRVDLVAGLDRLVGDGYDVVLAADVVEHTPDPVHLLRAMSERLADGGRILVSIPNFAHWYPRVRVASGRFDYDRRGILDTGHLRFFTRRSFERVAREAGLVVTRREAVGIPFEVLGRGGASSRFVERSLGAFDRQAVRAWPNMFGYQLLFELRVNARGHGR